jgi:hypothetical protein
MVRGTLTATSYPTSPITVVARDESGHSSTAALTEGAFSVALPSGHTYRLAVVTATGEVPMVFPRRSGTIDASFAVRSRGALSNLGAVRYLPHAPESGFQFATASSQEGECVDCADDDNDVICEDGAPDNDTGDDSATSDQADGTREMAVGEHNPPANIAGCENESDGESDDGEH